MKQISIIDRINRKRIFTYVALGLLLVGTGFAIATNMLNGASKTQAATLTSPDVMLLDGWSMSNANKLGRVAPKNNYNKTNIVVSGSTIRMDNSVGGFNVGGGNNPLFASVDSVDPSNLTPRSSDGYTNLNSLTVTTGGSVTNTPLDFMNKNNGSFYSQPFGVVWTGYYYDDASNADLEFAFNSDDGAKIEIYYGGDWHPGADPEETLYSNHGYSHPDETTLVAPFAFNYSAKTFLPIRITYYQAGGDGGFALCVKSADGKWRVPISGASSAAGNFYSGPDLAYPEGLVADVYLYYPEQDNTSFYKYTGTGNPFIVTGQGIGFDASIAFSMRRYYHSFVDNQYLHTFNDDRNHYNGHNSRCEIKRNTSYDTIADIYSDRSGCWGKANLFMNLDGSFNRQNTGLVEVDSTDTVTNWVGGNSRVKLKVAGQLSVASSSAIDVSASGWPGGSHINTGYVQSPDECTYTTGCLGYYGLGPSGGVPDYNDSTNNGVAGGGGFGGVGARSEFNPWNKIVGTTYGAINDVDYLGSGGGEANHDGYSSSGGGSIYILATEISVDSSSAILANGGHGRNNGGDGSGGSIHLIISADSDLFSTAPAIKANGGYHANRGSEKGGGGRIYIEGNFINSDTSNVQAKAGACGVPGFTCFQYSSSSIYWASDGTINIPGGQGLSIKKRLLPKSRLIGGTLSPDFNPYALQSGDLIQVEITATRINPPATVSDKFLTLAGKDYNLAKARCEPSDEYGVTGNALAGLTPSGSIANGSVTWNVTSGDNTSSHVFSYYCKVNTIP